MIQFQTDKLTTAILLVLRTGQENAITGKNLAGILKENGTRSIRLAIDELVEQGIPVCSGPTGYHIADSQEEGDEALRILRAYGKSIFIHYRNLKRACAKQFGSPEIRAGQLSLL